MLSEVDLDPDPREEIEVDPDPDLDPERGLKWIRIRPNAVDPGGSEINITFACICKESRKQAMSRVILYRSKSLP